MALALLIIGLILVVAGARGKAGELAGLVADDGKLFLPYAAVIFIVGSIGYFKTARPVVNAFLALVVIALILASGRQAAQQFSSAINGVSK